MTGTVKYSQTPPVGGDHDAVPLNCGIYTNPVAHENAVHSMEHGGGLDHLSTHIVHRGRHPLRHAVTGHSYVIPSPYTGLPSPVAAAWGVQLKLTSASDPRLAQFIAYYEQGP